jgi:hypothetical protein
MPAGALSTREDKTPEQHFSGRIGLENFSVPPGDFFFSDGEVGPLNADFLLNE